MLKWFIICPYHYLRMLVLSRSPSLVNWVYYVGSVAQSLVCVAWLHIRWHATLVSIHLVKYSYDQSNRVDYPMAFIARAQCGYVSKIDWNDVSSNRSHNVILCNYLVAVYKGLYRLCSTHQWSDWILFDPSSVSLPPLSSTKVSLIIQ